MFKGIEFTHSGFFWLLLAIPFLIFWYALKHKQQNTDLSVSSLDGLRGQNDIWSWLKHFLFVLRIGAIALIVIALARPQTVDISTKTKTLTISRDEKSKRLCRMLVSLCKKEERDKLFCNLNTEY